MTQPVQQCKRLQLDRWHSLRRDVAARAPSHLQEDDTAPTADERPPAAHPIRPNRTHPIVGTWAERPIRETGDHHTSVDAALLEFELADDTLVLTQIAADSMGRDSAVKMAIKIFAGASASSPARAGEPGVCTLRTRARPTRIRPVSRAGPTRAGRVQHSSDFSQDIPARPAQDRYWVYTPSQRIVSAHGTMVLSRHAARADSQSVP